MINIAIVDDEEDFGKAYQELLEKYFIQNNMQVSYSKFYNGKAVFESLWEYDLYFLDIEMPDIDGMELAEILRKKYGDKPEIVFVTAREMAVYNAFSVDALGFIRKTHLIDDFERTMRKFLKKWKQRNYKLEFQTDSGLIYKTVTEIIYVEVYGHRLTLYCTNGTYIMRKAIDNIRNVLPEESFVEPYRGYLVNCRFIDCIKNDVLILDNGQSIPLSRRRREKVKKKHLKYMELI